MRFAWIRAVGAIMLHATVVAAQPGAAVSRESLSIQTRALQGYGTDFASAAGIAEYIAGEVMKFGLAAPRNGYLQPIPLRIAQFDLPRSELRISYSADDIEAARRGEKGQSWFPPHTIGFLPLANVFDLNPPENVRVPDPDPFVALVIGGTLGASDAADPRDVVGKAVLFYPPLRADGQPDYQLWTVHESLVRYSEAAAIFVATLDLMPRSFIQRMTESQVFLRERSVRASSLPPVVAVSRGVLDYTRSQLLGIGQHDPDAPRPALAALRIAVRSIELPGPVRNVVAMLEGSDPVLKSEFVVVTAPLPPRRLVNPAAPTQESVDDAAVLLEIARTMAAGVRPSRSVVFVWTAAAAHGLLGAEFYVDHPSVPIERIVAALSVDQFGTRGSRLEIKTGHTVSPALAAWIDSTAAGLSRAISPVDAVPSLTANATAVCDGDHWHFARRGIPSVVLTTRADPRVSEDPDSAEVLARRAQMVAALVGNLATRAEPTQRSRAAALTAMCVR